MELIGKIYQKINNDSGYIIGEDEKLYLYFSYDFLEDFEIEIGQLVCFKAERGKILRATFISRFKKEEQNII